MAKSIDGNSAYWNAKDIAARSWEIDYEALFRMFAGRQIGRGMSRTVFTYEGPFVPKGEQYVLKVERHPETKKFQNVVEWTVWSETLHMKRIKQYLAPCVAISPCGRFLIQRRTEVPDKRQFPKRVPAFWTDLQRKNFGVLNGRLVCHDYGTYTWNLQDMSTKPKIAKWWD